VKARFYSDIEEMMYGFGDDWPPLRESVNGLDAIAVKYIEDLGKQDDDDDDDDDGDDDMMTTEIVMIMMIIAMGRI
jgi:hypothetical protein